MENASHTSITRRRGHKKSKAGCLTCKRRRVKCNEQHPSCAQCLKLELPCSYRNATTATTSLILLAPQPGSATPTSAIPPQPSVLLPLPIAELALLHHWTLKTAITLSVRATRHIWQNTIVELGFRYPFMLHAVLGAAAIHKATIDRPASAALYEHSLQHMDRAVSLFSEHLDKVDITMCSPMFLTSGLLIVHSLATAQVQRPADPIAATCLWMRLTRGAKNTLIANWDQIDTLEIAPMIFAATPDRSIMGNDLSLQKLQECVTDSQYTDGPQKDTCMQAIAILQIISANLKQAEGRETRSKLGIVCAWPALIDPTFIDLMAAHSPMALVIVAYFAGMLHGQATLWYVRGWADMIVDAVSVALPQDLRSWLEWPTQCLQQAQRPG